MTHYIGLVDKQADSAWGVWFPDVPGCFSAADRAEDILSNACQALEIHLEGIPAPVTRELDAIMALSVVQEAIAEGAALLSVPLFRNGARRRRVNITADSDMLTTIDAAARLRGLTRSAFLMQAARNEILGRPNI